MNRRLIHPILCTLFTVLVFTATVKADPVSQDITLEPGWNAIFLEVEPADTTPSVVFLSITDLQSVWQWNHRSGTVEFIQDPDQLVAPDPRMLAYIPGNIPVSNLSAIQGNSAYLVQIGGSSSQILTVTGEPALPRHVWKANSFNLTGFHLAETPLPSYIDFFASSPAHDGQTIYRLDNPTGTWQEVTTDQMSRGEAFWIYCDGSSSYNGPISVTLELSSGLHFGDKLFEQQLLLNNNSGEEKTFILTLPALSPVAPGNPVHYWVFDEADQVPSWEPFPASREFPVAPGDSQKVRIGVRRTGLPSGINHVTNIGVSDGDGVSFLLPFSVTGIDYAGLWTGFATINKVSDVNKLDDEGAYDPTPQPTGSEFDFRVIIHVNQDSGVWVALLSEVIQMWDEGELIPDPENLGGFIVDTPGQFVLLTDDTLIGDYSGSLLRDGQPIGRRISAPAFPRIPPSQRPLHGTAKDGTFFNPSPGNWLENLANPIVLAADDPTNPFVHMFHKTHGIVDGSLVDDNQYQITREISFVFSDEDADGNPVTGLPALNRGSTEIGGIYMEKITGLNDLEHPIEIMGTFVLHRVSNVATLIP